MNDFVQVKVPRENLLSELLNRCEIWETSKKNIDLFEKMYENAVFGGVFDDCEFDVMQIVDNDVINWCSVIYNNDEDFEQLLKLADDGEYDVSCEEFESNNKYSFIEAISDDRDRILIRW